jgi:Mg-chelatase subunit ChlD
MALFKGSLFQIFFIFVLISAQGLISTFSAQSDIIFNEMNPVTVILAIDGSATMGNSIEAAKSFSKCFIEELKGRNNKQDEIGIVVWNTTIDTNLSNLPTNNFADVSSRVDNISSTAGNTCLAVGLNYAISNLNTRYIKKIILLTDGNQDCSSIEDCRAVIKTANDKNISIYSIIIGKNCSYNLKEMECLRDFGYFKCMPYNYSRSACRNLFEEIMGKTPSIDASASPANSQIIPIIDRDLNTTFNLVGRGKEIGSKNVITNVSVTKYLEANENSNQRIRIKIETPPVEAADVIIAVDSSGSLNLGGQPIQSAVLKEAIPELLSAMNNSVKDLRISLVSWDNDIDFAYSDFSNKIASSATLVPLNSFTLGDINKNFASYYYANERETTNLDTGLDASLVILKNPKNLPKDPIKTKRFVIFIVGRSEFEGANWTLVDGFSKNTWPIYCVGIELISDSELEKELKAIKSATNGGYLPILAAQKSVTGTSSNLIKEEVLKYIESILTEEPIATNVTIVESLFPYLTPDLNSVTIDNKLIDKRKVRYNPNTNAITIDVGDLAPSKVTNVAFNTNFYLNLPVDVTYSSVDKVLRRSIMPSSISYLWFNNTTIRDGLPENNIEIKNANFVAQNSKIGGMESGLLSLFALFLILLYKNYRKN